ncbi:MAG: purine-nucleoside phosphorylase [Candidatus Bathyarchaeota archaeon]|nr:purine-nucleoside phosphorylase [Candidatus Bathyarchaeota archaeon]
MTLANDIDAAAAFVLARQRQRPSVGIILGSGLGSLAESVEGPVHIPYREIPGFAPTTVEGHKGEMVFGQMEGKTVAVLQGRLHAYEGYSPQQITFPVRVLKAIGCGVLMVTNAAGGLNPAYLAGDLMLISDHLNLPGMIGHNPLYGPNDPLLGPRFPDMSQAYDPGLRDLARQVAAELGFSLREGVYVMLGGPSYETPAEVHFLRVIGADAVGMSTASEVVVARHSAMRVLGVSMISNVIPLPTPGAAAGAGQHGIEGPLGHEEVLANAAKAAPRFVSLLRGVLRRL